MATILQQSERAAGRTACNWPTVDSVAEAVRGARTAVDGVRHATKDAADHLELTARRRPLAVVGAAAAAGFVTGGILAFALGWFAARRVHR
jgi:ElaB/YqjD/DUF883 family membrane-anchored ribosome-binding protein